VAVGGGIWLALWPDHESVEDRRANHPVQARAWAKDMGAGVLGLSCMPEFSRCDVRLDDGRIARLECARGSCWLARFVE
jgi:hypothetical protein